MPLGSNLATPRGVDSLHRPTIGKKLKKSSSLKPQGPQLDFLYVAMANGPLHKLCQSCPRGQNWPRPGGR